MTQRKSKTKTYVTVGVFSAIAFVLQVIGSMVGLKVPYTPLEIEFSDLPALIMALAFGPAAGVLTELIKNLLHCSITSTGFVGELANFLVNGTFCFVAGMIYKYNKTRKGAVIALTIASFVMAATSILSNLFITFPMFLPPVISFKERVDMVLFIYVPFNLVRGLALSLITFFIYKKISPIIK